MQVDQSRDYQKQSISNGRNFAYAIAHNTNDCHKSANANRLSSHIEKLKNEMRKASLAMEKCLTVRNAILTQRNHMNNPQQVATLKGVNAHIVRLQKQMRRKADLIAKDQYKLSLFINGQLYQPIKTEKNAFDKHGKLTQTSSKHTVISVFNDVTQVENVKTNYQDLQSCKTTAQRLTEKHGKPFVVYRYSTEGYTRDHYDIVPLDKFDEFDMQFRACCYVIYTTTTA